MAGAAEAEPAGSRGKAATEADWWIMHSAAHEAVT